MTGLEPATPGVTGRYSNQLSYNRASCRLDLSGWEAVARLTGLEPATPGVTGRYSNQLSYNRPKLPVRGDASDVRGVLGGRVGGVKRDCTHNCKKANRSPDFSAQAPENACKCMSALQIFSHAATGPAPAISSPCRETG